MMGSSVLDIVIRKAHASEDFDRSPQQSPSKAFIDYSFDYVESTDSLQT
jgi:hypothetical protein